MTTLDKSGEEEERHNMPTRAKFLKTKCMDAIHSASTKYDWLSLWINLPVAIFGSIVIFELSRHGATKWRNNFNLKSNRKGT